MIFVDELHYCSLYNEPTFDVYRNPRPYLILGCASLQSEMMALPESNHRQGCAMRLQPHLYNNSGRVLVNHMYGQHRAQQRPSNKYCYKCYLEKTPHPPTTCYILQVFKYKYSLLGVIYMTKGVVLHLKMSSPCSRMEVFRNTF